MRKVWVVAKTEFLMILRSKAFLLSAIALPSIMVLVGVLGKYNSKSALDRKLGVIDQTGVLFPLVEARAKIFNQMVRADEQANEGLSYLPFLAEGASPEELRLSLSQQVRDKKIAAFVELPKELIAANLSGDTSVRPIYYSESLVYDNLLRWFDASINDELRKMRYEKQGISADILAKLEIPHTTKHLGLFVQDETGQIVAEKREESTTSLLIPTAVLMVFFFLVTMSTSPLLNAVLEEKLSRVSEVMLGAVEPSSLLFGKLAASVASSLVLGILYISTGIAALYYFSYGDFVPFHLLPLFVLFLVTAVLFFGSVFLSVGAACSDHRDAQSFLLPVTVLMMLPMLAFSSIMQSPSGAAAVSLSLFPPSAPAILLFRIALQGSVPIWQPMVGVPLSLLCTWFVIKAAGKIFRIGLLMQGKSANFRQILSWLWLRS